MITYDRQTIDNSGAFLIGQLERFDPVLNMPLLAYTWSRDVDLREDVSIADEISSFSNSSFAAPSSVGTDGESWISNSTNVIAGVDLDIQKTTLPLTPWSRQLSWTVFELASALQMGRPIDSQKLEAMNQTYQLNVDRQVYVGSTILGVKGLFNQAGVKVINAAKTWASSTAMEIAKSINDGLTTAWKQTGRAVVPDSLRLPPDQYALLSSIIVSDAGNRSLLDYLSENTIAYKQNGKPLDIQPVKWLEAGAMQNVNRMVFYTKDRKYVQFPLVPLQRTPMEYRDLRQLVTYYSKVGAVELRYSDTMLYVDGI
ncbi:hypothetical protein NS303_04505 [Pantoea ananatis]|uniref:DUF2184 domain-containing protein n=1 Tax=Pantoea ananas TaxID=553 RepID=UPI0007363BAD|nr:DUF2184 domain-containing protein [Pantoea ananatis]KTR49338.1 hypothetical protein NS303_04505 [Pantoea ananatis]KTR51164.1 hypothetical protein NS311_21525 [Pantoea ananatis]KTR65481.1 hypothetical protein RSA47_05415 [Pantoea ananatis]KTR69712.1 hypothetical protein NS296_13950 [Pantoea ananatis]